MSEHRPSKNDLPAKLRKAMGYGLVTRVQHVDQVYTALAEQAADEIERLQHELNRVTRGDVSNIVTTLGDALTQIGILEQRLRTAHEPGALNVAPIAKLTVRDGLVARAGLYAPGLPDGDHDVFPVPLNPNGEMRAWPTEPPPDIRALFNKGVGVLKENRFSFSFETDEEAEQAFRYIADLGTLETSRPPSTKSENPRVELAGAACAQHAGFADSGRNAGSTPAPGSSVETSPTQFASDLTAAQVPMEGPRPGWNEYETSPVLPDFSPIFGGALTVETPGYKYQRNLQGSGSTGTYSPPPFRHWEKDCGVPFDGCNCATCAEYRDGLSEPGSPT